MFEFFKNIFKNPINDLINAIRNGDIPLVKEKMKCINNINYETEDGVTPLSMACLMNNIEIAKLLIDSGANVNHISQDGRVYPLDAAIRAGNEEVIKFIISRGADVNLFSTKQKFLTPLLSAIFSERNDMLKLLLENGASKTVNVECAPCFHPLITSASFSNFEGFELILKHGGDINYKNKYHQTTLWYLCSDVDIKDERVEFIRSVLKSDIKYSKDEALSFVKNDRLRKFLLNAYSYEKKYNTINDIEVIDILFSKVYDKNLVFNIMKYKEYFDYCDFIDNLKY